MQMVRDLPDQFRAFAAQSRGTAFDERFLEALPRVLALLEQGAAIEPQLQGLPRVPVHCDYHPGNLKYRDEEAVALFDFDWSKVDYRLFDVAEGIAYFCSSWEGADDGEVRLDKAARFVRAYQDEAARFDVPGPLSAEELALLPRMVANANLYVLNWDLAAYYEDPGVSVDEYLMYLDHQLQFMEYIEAQMVGELPQTFRDFAAASRGTAFDQRFIERLPRVLELLERAARWRTTCGGCPASPCIATTTRAISSGSTSRASGSSISTGPSWTTGCSTWRRASPTSAARGRATTTATYGLRRRRSSFGPIRTRRRGSRSPAR